MTDIQDLKFELEYWQQICKDHIEVSKEFGKINNTTYELIGLAQRLATVSTLLVAMGNESAAKLMVAPAEVIMDSIQAIQISLLRIKDIEERAEKLVGGRMKVLGVKIDEMED